jgi:proteic killer suppression protein
LRNSQNITLDVISAGRYYINVIRSFKDPETERIFGRERSRKLPPSIQRSALRKLLVLDAADSLADLRVPPGNRLEKLSGNRKGQHSIRINDQWRICFRWKDGDALDVEIADYH